MSRMRALWALTATVLIWASSFAVIKVGLREINPYFLAFIRALIAAAFLVAIIALRGELATFVRYVRANWRVLCSLGLIGIALFDVLQNVGIKHTSSALAGVLLNTNPLFIALFSAMILGEIITRNKALGMTLGFLGMCLVVFGGEDIGEVIRSQTFLGNALVVLSAITWAVYSIMNKRALIDDSPLHLTAASYLFGTMFSVPLIFFFDIGPLFDLTFVSWGVIVYLGAIASGTTFFLWSYALSKMDASRASVFLFLIPVVAIFVGWIFLDERILWSTVAGGVLVLSGIYLAEKKSRVAELATV